MTTDANTPADDALVLVPTSPHWDLARLTFDDAAAAAHGYAAHAKSENTRLAYRGDWQRFEAWCALAEVPCLPAAGTTLAAYLAARAKEGRRPSTIARAAAVIAQAHKAAGHPSPTATTAVRLVMQGIRRQQGVKPAQKAPVLIEDLRLMLAALDGNQSPRAVRNRALLLLGFAGAFRRTELVGIDVEHVEDHRDGLRVHLLRSKTDPTGIGRVIGIPYGGKPLTCPVRALRSWLTLSGITQGAIFRGVTAGGNLTANRLLGGDVARIVKSSAEAAGLDATNFSGHSLRAGLVTAAVRAGKAEHVIMRQTGHTTTQMLRRYIRDEELFDENAATGIGL